MKALRYAFALLVCTVVFGIAQAQQGPPKPKRILAIGQTKGFQHDSVSTGLATMWKMGRDTGLWDTYIKTDCQLITKKKLQGNAKNLDYFDAVYFYTTGELDLDDSQKADLISFVKEDGKGFLGGHSAIDTNYKWPEYGEMVGAYFDQHPWGTFEAPVIIEDRASPMTALFPAHFVVRDEIYQPSSIWSRDKVHVLARLDETKIDLKNPRVHRTDGDFAVAWIKTFGKGRVFYTTFGHVEEVYDRRDMQQLYREAAKWCLRLTDHDVSSHAKTSPTE
ncbi:MAG: ThuA domain-containing protein [Acidobacteria bacterium]|nr:ThuA domain-containing protein [Acidobacteriota bacterium]